MARRLDDGTTKVCRECDQALPLSEFPTKAQLGRTYLYSYCRPCKNARLARWRLNNPEKNRAQTAAFRDRHRDDLRERDRKAYRTRYEKDPTVFVRQSRAWKDRNPERARVAGHAHNVVRRAILRGDINKPTTCEQCSATNVAIEASHSDYSQPLNVRWLCRSCHRREDARDPKTKEVAG